MYAQAAAQLDSPEVKRLYARGSGIIWELDRGAVALALDDHDECIRRLEEAERRVELVRRRTLGDVVGQWVLNDKAAPYVAEPYEDIYINVLKLLAQLEAGRVQGGATVEARRANRKADMLRDTYVRYEDALDREAAKRGGGRAVRAAGAGDFIESPLGTFLSTVTFMKSGDREFQRVAGKRLLSSIELQSGLPGVGGVNAAAFEGLGEAHPQSANVLVVALSGRGPRKRAEKVGPETLGPVPIYFELPALDTFPSEVRSVRVEVAGGPDEGGRVESGKELSLVEDLGAVAAENHRRQLPLIRARTLLRLAIKAGATFAATEAARGAVSDDNQQLVQIAGVAAGILLIAATEHADVRCWMFLPGRAHVGLMQLPPGPHRLRVVYSGARDHVGEWRTVEVSDAGLATIVEQYWR